MTASVEVRDWNQNIDGEFSFNAIAELNLITFSDSQGITLTKDDSLSYFYSGNAVSYPSINFSVPIHFDTNGYIDTFSNSYSKHNNNQEYNTLNL